MYGRKKARKLAANASEAITYIGPGVTIEGTVHASAPLRIDGRVQGAVKAKEEITVGETGIIEGPVEGTKLLVAGEVKGSVILSRELRIRTSGRLIGDVQTPQLVVEEGAVFKGNSEMIKEELPSLPERGLVGERPRGSRALKEESGEGVGA